MNHPSIIDLAELLKGKLPSQQARELTGHLQVCDACQVEWETTQSLEDLFAQWKSPSVSASFLSGVMQSLTSNQVHSPRAKWILNPWLRRIALASGVLITTLLIQLLVWNPLNQQRQMRTIFELIPMAYALSIEEGLPDTTLVIQIDSDGQYRTNVLDGTFSLAGIKSRLNKVIAKGEYKTLVIHTSNLRNPINLRFKDLLFFKRRLGIREFRFFMGDPISGLGDHFPSLEELGLRVGIGRSRIEITEQGIGIKPIDQLIISIDTNGRIALPGSRILTLDETDRILRTFFHDNPTGKLLIRYWESITSDSVRVEVKELATEIGISNIKSLKLDDK